ncbi:YheC/YheD family protein [Azospirillum sp. A39]|uniref:YheC/YheD family protein n=1 Tax=Azospirillum sp. A39 TaxID=3462279 RepID=UPI004045BD5F
MVPRVLIGLFTAARPPLEAVEPVRLRALAAEALVQRVDFVVFGSDDVDLLNRAVRGRSLDGDDWREGLWPLPRAVMNPVRPQSDVDWAVAEELRRLAPFTTARIADKVAVSGLLGASPVAAHVIPYESLPMDLAAAEGEAGVAGRLDRFLAAHGRVVAKPARGRRGRDIRFLTRTADGRLREWRRGVERPTTLAAAAADLVARLRGEPWILQRFIPSRTRDERSFDVRVHVHKDGAGAWTVVRAYVRLSEAGGLVTNTCCGGYQGDVDRFFAGLKGDARPLVAGLRALGLATAEALDARYGGALDELGIDLMVDGQRRPWIVEVNTHPQSRHHEFERARYAVAYAAHLARGTVAAGRTLSPAAVG